MKKLARISAIAGAVLALGSVSQIASAGPCQIDGVHPYKDPGNHYYIAIHGSGLNQWLKTTIEICGQRPDKFRHGRHRHGWDGVIYHHHGDEFIALAKMDNEDLDHFGEYGWCNVQLTQRASHHGRAVNSCDSEGLIMASSLMGFPGEGLDPTNLGIDVPLDGLTPLDTDED